MKNRYEPLFHFNYLSIKQKLLFILLFFLAWISLDYFSILFSIHKAVCSWYPNVGLSFGLIAFFGWPVSVLEFIARLLMSKVLWIQEPFSSHHLVYSIVPTVFSSIMALTFRKVVIRRGLIESLLVAAVFTFFVFLGMLLRAILSILIYSSYGIMDLENFVLNSLHWWSGDMIGLTTVTPMIMFLFGPLFIQKIKIKLHPKLFTHLFVTTVYLVGLAGAYFFIFQYKHFNFWHLVIPIHIYAAWWLGLRWITLQIIFVNLLLSVVEIVFPSPVRAFEQQFFLTLITGGTLYLSFLFNERKSHLKHLASFSFEVQKKSEDESNFLKMLSHEIRTPLSRMMAYIEELSLDSSGQQYKNQVDKIRVEIQKLQNLFEKLISLSKPSQILQSLKYTQFNLCHLIENSILNLKTKALEKGLEFKFECTNPHISVYSSADIISKVVNELVQNSVKFTTNGSITIRVKKTSTGPQIQVIDTGIGIDPEFKLFSTFEQEMSGLKREYPGLGIGLSACRSMIESIGGHLYLKHSEKGKGSTFIIDVFDLPVT